MKIRVKVVCTFLTLSKKPPPPLFQILATRLSLLHVNLRSINKFQNFDTFEEFLTDLSFSPDIVCVSETRLKGEPLINISKPNFNFVHADSTTKAGWVAIYVSSKFYFELDRELEMHIKGCEDLWIKLT